MNTNGMRSMLVLVLIITALSYVLYHQLFNNKHYQAMENDQFYYHGWIKINQHLYLLSKTCRMGNMDVAHNAFEELKQEWMYQDVIARNSPNRLINQYHFPSDSLVKLDSMLAHETENVHCFKTNPQIILEIKRINDKMDRMLGLMQKGGTKR